MARNANTAHSKALRQKTAAEFQKKLTAANRLEIRNKDADVIAAIRAGLAGVPGETNADKILYLLDIYNKIEK